MRSLKIVGSRHPLILIHTGKLSSQAMAQMEAEGIVLLQTPQFEPPDGHGDYAHAYFAECW